MAAAEVRFNSLAVSQAAGSCATRQRTLTEVWGRAAQCTRSLWGQLGGKSKDAFCYPSCRECSPLWTSSPMWQTCCTWQGRQTRWVKVQAHTTWLRHTCPELSRNVARCGSVEALRSAAKLLCALPWLLGRTQVDELRQAVKQLLVMKNEVRPGSMTLSQDLFVERTLCYREEEWRVIWCQRAAHPAHNLP